MRGLNATELAKKLNVSKARISQYVSSGKLEGCYQGEGRSRIFYPAKVAQALGKQLDLAQMTANGLSTRRALREIADDDAGAPQSRSTRSDAELQQSDPDRLELATIQIKEEEARRRRRENAREEGLWVLSEEVQRSSARALATEIGQFETVLRDASRAVADRMGVDYREVRKILMDHWRAHRARRAAQLAQAADEATMTDAERSEQD